MSIIKLFEEFKDEYKGYLTGSLSYLYKHKKELESKIKKLDSMISSQKSSTDRVGGSISKKSFMNRMDMIRDWQKEKDSLTTELEEVNSNINKYVK